MTSKPRPFFFALFSLNFMLLACGVPVDSEDGRDDPGDVSVAGDRDAGVTTGGNGTTDGSMTGGSGMGSGGRPSGGADGAGGLGPSGGDTGAGGTASTGGTDGVGGNGPVSCQPAFETACKPTIVFDNQHSDGGGALFDELFPDIESEMKDIACTVCSMLYRTPEEIPESRRHSTVNLTIDAHDGVAYASGNSIVFSVNHLQNYTNPDSAYVEYRGVLVHETVHLYQNYGNGGTGEGMADTIRVRVGLYPPGRCGPGGSWRDAYTTSGCFYSWLSGPSLYHESGHPSADPDLPYKINAALAGTSGEDSYTAVANLLQTNFGQDVDTLWSMYQSDL